jgi:uncharacterized membrane protein
MRVFFNTKTGGYFIFILFIALIAFCYFTKLIQEDWFFYTAVVLFFIGVALIKFSDRAQKRNTIQSDKV